MLSNRATLTTVVRCHHQVTVRSMSAVGFIGLGNMGNSMAKNLLTNANIGQKMPVVVFDLNKDSVAKLVAQGAQSADTVKELAQKCDVIVTMLPATAHVKGTLTGPDGIFANAKKGTLIIDSSTIDPLASRDLVKQAHAAGMHMIDAPVSGGVTGAAAGTLTFMVGGTDSDLELARVRPVFLCLSDCLIICFC
jgi:3-hydroxyisobutyrate dehydrogenase